MYGTVHSYQVYISSTHPNSATSALPVFGPIPFTPGMLSAESPTSAK